MNSEPENLSSSPDRPLFSRLRRQSLEEDPAKNPFVGGAGHCDAHFIAEEEGVTYWTVHPSEVAAERDERQVYMQARLDNPDRESG